VKGEILTGGGIASLQLCKWLVRICRLIDVNVWTKREMLSGFWWGNLKGRDRLEDLGADGLIKLISV
jgi:hypothetical protein